MNKSVIVLSGGQDSATTLILARDTTEVVGAIHFQYGQRHGIEGVCAKWWADQYAIPLEIVELDALSQLGDSRLLVEGDISEPHPRLAHLPSSFVPGRNLVFFTLAAAYAMKVGATQIWSGVCQTDYSGYPDCRRETVDALETAIRLGMDFQDFQIVTPLMYLNKAQTFEVAVQHGELQNIVDSTHTCYEGVTDWHEWGRGCGECPACALRVKGYYQWFDGEYEAVPSFVL